MTPGKTLLCTFIVQVSLEMAHQVSTIVLLWRWSWKGYLFVTLRKTLLHIHYSGLWGYRALHIDIIGLLRGWCWSGSPLSHDIAGRLGTVFFFFEKYQDSRDLWISLLVLKDWFFIVFSLGGFGGLERTYFQQLLLWEILMVLKGLNLYIFYLGGFCGLESLIFKQFHFGRLWKGLILYNFHWGVWQSGKDWFSKISTLRDVVVLKLVLKWLDLNNIHFGKMWWSWKYWFWAISWFSFAKSLPIELQIVFYLCVHLCVYVCRLVQARVFVAASSKCVHMCIHVTCICMFISVIADSSLHLAAMFIFSHFCPQLFINICIRDYMYEL